MHYKFKAMKIVLLLLAAGTTLISAQTVMIHYGSSAILLGSTVSMTCTLVGSAATDLMYRWRVGGTIEQDFDASNTFIVFSVSLSDARDDYMCEVRETATGAIYSATTALNITVQDFTLSFTRDGVASLPIPYVGANVSYSCQTLSPGNLEGLVVRVDITNFNGTRIESTGQRVMASETREANNAFERTLFFSPLSIADEGLYRCTVTIEPDPPNPHFINKVISTEQILTVIGQQLQVQIEPVSATERYLDIEPYNSLSLTCSVTILLRNDPLPLDIEFSWLRSVNSGPQEELTPDLYTNSRVYGSAETSILTVRAEQPGNHAYTCRVNLDVRPAPDVIANEHSRSLDVIGPADPFVPLNLTTPSDYVFNNSVTVQWLVTSLSYGPESYRVLYGLPGAELDMESPVVTSGDNITVTDLSLSVQLTELMPGTMYNYQLEISNSANEIRSPLQSFTTSSSSSSSAAFSEPLVLSSSSMDLPLASTSDSEPSSQPLPLTPLTQLVLAAGILNFYYRF